MFGEWQRNVGQKTGELLVIPVFQDVFDIAHLKRPKKEPLGLECNWRYHYTSLQPYWDFLKTGGMAKESRHALRGLGSP